MIATTGPVQYLIMCIAAYYICVASENDACSVNIYIVSDFKLMFICNANFKSLTVLLCWYNTVTIIEVYILYLAT